MEPRFGSWNIRRLHRTGALKTVARELGKYKLDLVYGRSDGRRVALNGQRIIHFSMEQGMGIINYGQVSFIYKRIVSSVRRMEFIGDRMSYIILRDLWYNIIILNVQAPREDKSDDVKDSFYEELGRVF
jgi:hypothetical protein